MQPPPLTHRHAVFLDFDGTLVEIAPTPDGVALPDELLPVLVALRTRLMGAVAIVTGRQLSDIDQYLHPLNLACSGSHGTERRSVDGRYFSPDAAVSRTVREISGKVRRRVGQRPGLLFEHKDWSAAIHYRNAPDLEAMCIGAMRAVVEEFPDWQVVEGKMIVEARLRGVTKATPVEAFMHEEPFAGRTPVFIGDDTTDEDGMRASMAHGGFGIKVGEGESIAGYRLSDPAAVLAYLQT